jgi:ESCRT-I complex subunit VPS28
MTMRGDRVKCVAEIVELFITLMDQINLNIRSVDDLFQTLNNLHSALNSMSFSQEDEIKSKVKKWYTNFKDLNAGTEISDDDYKQIRLDISTAYDAFQRSL